MRNLDEPIVPLAGRLRASQRRSLIQGTVLSAAGAACILAGLSLDGFRDIVEWIPEIAVVLLISGMGVNGWAKYLKGRTPRRSAAPEARRPRR